MLSPRMMVGRRERRRGGDARSPNLNLTAQARPVSALAAAPIECETADDTPTVVAAANVPVSHREYFPAGVRAPHLQGELHKPFEGIVMASRRAAAPRADPETRAPRRASTLARWCPFLSCKLGWSCG